MVWTIRPYELRGAVNDWIQAATASLLQVYIMKIMLTQKDSITTFYCTTSCVQNCTNTMYAQMRTSLPGVDVRRDTYIQLPKTCTQFVVQRKMDLEHEDHCRKDYS